jgi:hypothetical protein
VFTAVPVVRVIVTPLTDSVVDADTTVVPVVAVVSVIVQLPVPPEVVHGFGAPSVPGPETIANVIDVPSEAGPNPLPVFTSTVAVKVCVAVIGLIADCGVIEMFASTQFFCAFPLPPGPGFEAVVRVIVCPLTGMSEVAWTTVVPTAVEVIVTVQLAVAAPPV